jgi:NUMOD3 motif
MNEFYTYAFLREDRTPYYIGKGTGNRIYSTYRKGAKPPKDKSRIIYLKQNLTEEQAFKHEIYMIAVFGRKDLGTGILINRTDGGEGSSGVLQSEETKIKRSKALKGHIVSSKTRKKMSEASKNPSEETRKKISEAHKGKSLSEEHRQKLSVVKIGKTHSEEHRRKNSEAHKNPSEETRKKMSEAQKGNTKRLGKTHSEETRKKLGTASKGRKWWNDGCGNCKFVLECPGDGWRLGRK